MRTAVMAAALVVACGGTPKPAAHAPAPRVVTYSPLGFKADAKAPNQAVILGTDDHDGSTVIPLVAVAPAAQAPWSAEMWTSALVVANALDKDVTDLAFPAATGTGSARIAAGFLAALTGAPVADHASVTGTLNPDGSTDAGDIYDAYQQLTGKQLPRPVPVSEADMALDPATTAALETKYKQWQQRVAADWSTLVQLDTAGRLPELLVAMRTYAKSYAEQAETLRAHGRIGAAYSRMLEAWAFGSATTQAYDVLSKVQSGNVAAAIDAIKALDHLDETTTGVLQNIGAMRPTTLGDHLEMLAAFQAALRGHVFKYTAAPAIAATTEFLQSLSSLPPAQLGSPDTGDKVMQAVAPTVLYVARTVTESTLASQELEFETDQSVPYTASNLLGLAAPFSSAATAELAQVDTLLDLNDGTSRRHFAVAEPDYLIVSVMSKLALDDLKAAWGESSPAWGLLQLAASQLAYADAAGLIAKYGSLGAHVDDTGKIDKLAHDKALVHMLAAAERSARASARAAQIATGAIPVQAKLAYQLAAAERTGDLADQLDALAEFWASSAFSQTAVMLARN